MKAAITKVVRSIQPRPEVKFATLWNGDNVSADVYGIQYNAAIGTGTNVNLLPPVPQGTGNGQRIGERISPKRLVIDFVLNPTNYVSSVDLIARLFILESKNLRSAATINTVDMSALIDYGQVLGSFDGYTSNLAGRVNTDAFIVHMDKQLKLQKGYGQGPNIGNLYNGAVGQPNVFHKFRVVIKCPKVLHYASAASAIPDGFGPFFNMGYAVPSFVAADGVDILSTRAQVQFNSTLYYTDV